MGLHVGVGRTGHRAAVRRGQLEPGQPVVAGPHQGDEAQQHRQVGLDRRLHPLTDRLESDPTVDVMKQRRDDQRHDQRGEHPPDHERQERQTEHVEADVAPELGVDHAEVHPVGEQQPLLPPVAHPEPGDQCK